MNRKQSCQIDLSRSTRHHLPDKANYEQYFSKKYPANFDKYSTSTPSVIPHQRSFTSTGHDFLTVKRLPDTISSIRETFSYNPINLSKEETDLKLKSNKSKNERLNELLNIALDLQKMQKKSPLNRDHSKKSIGLKLNDEKHIKSQNVIEQRTAPSYQSDKNLILGHSEKQIGPYLKVSKPYNYDKSHSVTVQQQIQKIRQQNQKRKSENAKPKQSQESFYGIKIPYSPNQNLPKKQYTEYFSPKLQKSSHLNTFSAGSNTLSPYQKRKKQTSFQIKCHSPNKVSPSQIKKNTLNQNPKLKIEKKQNQLNSIQNFKMVKVLGKGRFGIVHLAFHKETGCLFAIKVIKKETIKANKLIDQFILQVKLQSYLNHPFILRVFGIFDDIENIYLVMEYLQQGCLFNYLKSCNKKKLQESDAAQKVKYLAESIKYLQDRGIAHRDIKPQNIIMNHGVCKLADFGWATFCDEERRKTYCGTCDYVAPEILQGQQYDETVDLWCIGVLAYELVAGKAPFYHMSQKETRNKIINANIIFPQDFSENLKSFITGLVQKDPEQRMTIQQVLAHPFIKNVNLCE